MHTYNCSPQLANFTVKFQLITRISRFGILNFLTLVFQNLDPSWPSYIYTTTSFPVFAQRVNTSGKSVIRDDSSLEPYVCTCSSSTSIVPSSYLESIEIVLGIYLDVYIFSLLRNDFVQSFILELVRSRCGKRNFQFPCTVDSCQSLAIRVVIIILIKIISRINLELNTYNYANSYDLCIRNTFVSFRVILKLFFIVLNFDQINSLSKGIPSDDRVVLQCKRRGRKLQQARNYRVISTN